MSGFVTIERRLWDHPLFTPAPMTEREAWMWMIAQAAWAETRHRVGSELVTVPRGSFMATLREMQSAFMWGSDKRVRTFLKMLEKEGMIGRTTLGAKNAPKTQISICNYDEYQSRGRTKDAPKTQDRTHHGRTTDAVKEQGNKGTTEEANASLSLVPTDDGPDDVSLAIDLFKEAAGEAGWPVPRILSKARKVALRARLKECGGIEGWRIAMDKAKASDHCCGNNDRGWVLTFDFITNAKSFAKLMEGNYDNRDSKRVSGANAQGGKQQTSMASIIAQRHADQR